MYPQYPWYRSIDIQYAYAYLLDLSAEAAIGVRCVHSITIVPGTRYAYLLRTQVPGYSVPVQVPVLVLNTSSRVRVYTGTYSYRYTVVLAVYLCTVCTCRVLVPYKYSIGMSTVQVL